MLNTGQEELRGGCPGTESLMGAFPRTTAYTWIQPLLCVVSLEESSWQRPGVEARAEGILRGLWRPESEIFPSALPDPVVSCRALSEVFSKFAAK